MSAACNIKKNHPGNFKLNDNILPLSWGFAKGSKGTSAYAQHAHKKLNDAYLPPKLKLLIYDGLYDVKINHRYMYVSGSGSVFGIQIW